MSRFHEGDGDGPNTQGLWDSAFRRAISSPRGQRVLKAIEAALLAMPEKRLVAEEIAYQGQVCAVGAVAAHSRVLEGMSWPDAVNSLEKEFGGGGQEDTIELAAVFDMARTLAWELGFENDEVSRWHHGPDITPEQRYEHILKWVQDRIKAEVAA